MAVAELLTNVWPVDGFEVTDADDVSPIFACHGECLTDARRDVRHAVARFRGEELACVFRESHRTVVAPGAKRCADGIDDSGNVRLALAERGPDLRLVPDRSDERCGPLLNDRQLSFEAEVQDADAGCPIHVIAQYFQKLSLGLGAVEDDDVRVAEESDGEIFRRIGFRSDKGDVTSLVDAVVHVLDERCELDRVFGVDNERHDVADLRALTDTILHAPHRAACHRDRHGSLHHQSGTALGERRFDHLYKPRNGKGRALHAGFRTSTCRDGTAEARLRTQRASKDTVFIDPCQGSRYLLICPH